MSEQFLSPKDLAIRWALHVQTLTTWRSLRRGPPFVKLGKAVRYAMSDVLEFERNGLRKPVPKAAPEMVVPEELGPQLTVRDVAASLSLGGCDGGVTAQGQRRPSQRSPTPRQHWRFGQKNPNR